jgi:hypothetical protein
MLGIRGFSETVMAKKSSDLVGAVSEVGESFVFL